jgi:NADPH-dependent 7-cyano-7-deazaguanine reductase QueF
MHRFLKSSRAEHQQEVSSVSGEVILSPRGDATSICPITGQPSLAPIPVTRIAIGAILQWTFPLRGALRAYPVPLK